MVIVHTDATGDPTNTNVANQIVDTLGAEGLVTKTEQSLRGQCRAANCAF
jgi:hypothetical protein